MNKPAVVIGMGEMGGVFARALLKTGTPVYPVLRSDNLSECAEQFPEPVIVLVAVAEKDLHPTLDSIPAPWRNNLVLLQNELLPRDWLAHQLTNPTVISVWFEKKKGQDFKVLVPSPIYGPQAGLLANSLASLDIPSQVLSNENELLFQLVRKNVYILTTNIAGLITDGTVDGLWNNHQTLARAVASDVMDIQDWLTGVQLDREQLIQGMVDAINGDLEHRCKGRSAPARLAGAIENADKAGLQVSTLRDILSKNIG